MALIRALTTNPKLLILNSLVTHVIRHARRYHRCSRNRHFTGIFELATFRDPGSPLLPTEITVFGVADPNKLLKTVLFVLAIFNELFVQVVVVETYLQCGFPGRSYFGGKKGHLRSFLGENVIVSRFRFKTCNCRPFFV